MSEVHTPLRIVLADDHPLWRDALTAGLATEGIEVVGVAEEGAEVIALAHSLRPDVCLTDLHMPGISGVEVARALAPAIPVLVCSASAEHRDVLAATAAGASGYVVKSATAPEIADALRATHRGEAVFTPGLAGLVLEEMDRLAALPRNPVEKLSEREREVLRLVARGLTSRQIGERLFLSHRTVENHIQRTLHRLHLHNRAQLVRFALDNDLTDED